jgi:homoserine dehydrogenase
LSSDPWHAGVDLDNWRAEWAAAADGDIDVNAAAAHLEACCLANTLIIDCTSADSIANRYLGWMRRGIHIVTPNKKLGSGPLPAWEAVRRHSRRDYTHWFYEARRLCTDRGTICGMCMLCDARVSVMCRSLLSCR